MASATFFSSSNAAILSSLAYKAAYFAFSAASLYSSAAFSAATAAISSAFYFSKAASSALSFSGTASGSFFSISFYNSTSFSPLLTLSPASANLSRLTSIGSTASNFFFSSAVSFLRAARSESFIIGSGSPFFFASSLTWSGVGNGAAGVNLPNGSSAKATAAFASFTAASDFLTCSLASAAFFSTTAFYSSYDGTASDAGAATLAASAAGSYAPPAYGFFSVAAAAFSSATASYSSFTTALAAAAFFSATAAVASLY